MVSRTRMARPHRALDPQERRFEVRGWGSGVAVDDPVAVVEERLGVMVGCWSSNLHERVSSSACVSLSSSRSRA